MIFHRIRELRESQDATRVRRFAALLQLSYAVKYQEKPLGLGPFLERPGNLTGPKSDFEIKISRKVGCVLNSNKVHFVSLANNFTV